VLDDVLASAIAQGGSGETHDAQRRVVQPGQPRLMANQTSNGAWVVRPW
jgi:hypothetical protein